MMMKTIKNQREGGLNLTLGISSGKAFLIKDRSVQPHNTICFRCSLTGCVGVPIQEMGMLYLPGFVDYAYLITC